MNGTHLGELEEITLLMVANLHDNICGMLMKSAIALRPYRGMPMSKTHNVLQRLQDKGHLASRNSEVAKVRGGRRRLLFTVTAGGHATLENLKDMRERLWSGIPKMAFA